MNFRVERVRCSSDEPKRYGTMVDCKIIAQGGVDPWDVICAVVWDEGHISAVPAGVLFVLPESSKTEVQSTTT